MSRETTAVAIIAIVLVGCGPKGIPPAGVPVAPPEDCYLLPGEVRPAPALRVGLTEPVDPAHAPDPANESERLVFRHLYETLVAVDCEGEVHPALAESWSREEGGRVTTFVLRGGARFADGTPVTATAVRESWSRSAARSSLTRAPWSWVNPESLQVLAPDRFSVSLPRSLGPSPSLFANPALAVTKGGGPDGWRFGSGPYTLETIAEHGFTLVPNPDHPERTRGLSPLRFEVRLGGDSRDLLSQGVDLLLVSDRSALDYAKELPDHEVRGLSYTRLYFIASPRLPTVFPPGEESRGLERLRLELALHVSGSDARPARYFHFDADESPDCGPRNSAGGGAPPAAEGTEEPLRIFHSEEDGDAQRLTARLIALTEPGASIPPVFAWGSPSSGDPVAAPLSPLEFAGALRRGGGTAYVFSIRRNFPGPCLDREALFESVPWLRCAAGGCEEAVGNGSLAPRSGALVPLVVTRAHLVARRDVGGVLLDWDGVPLLARAGKRIGEPKA